MVSPKLDGVRVLIRGQAVLHGHTWRPIPNRFAQRLFGTPACEGFDGVLVVGGHHVRGAYKRTFASVMTLDGEPDVWLYVFDMAHPDAGFARRQEMLRERIMKGAGALKSVAILGHHTVYNQGQLQEYENKVLSLGYKAVVIRDPNGLYKCSRRLTPQDQGMLKLRSYEGEAKITDVTGEGNLDALRVRDTKTGTEFEIRAGFNDLERNNLWLWFITGHNGIVDDPLVGKVVRYRYRSMDAKGRPQLPVFVDFS
jgi:hypothetical protein